MGIKSLLEPMLNHHQWNTQLHMEIIERYRFQWFFFLMTGVLYKNKWVQQMKTNTQLWIASGSLLLNHTRTQVLISDWEHKCLFQTLITIAHVDVCIYVTMCIISGWPRIVLSLPSSVYNCGIYFTNSLWIRNSDLFKILFCFTSKW